MDAVNLALALGGLVDHRTLLANVEPSEIRRALASGELVRVRRGRYGLPSTDAAWPEPGKFTAS